MFYEIIYFVIYVAIIAVSYFLFRKAIVKQVGVEQFTEMIFFVTAIAAVMMPGVILGIIQLMLYILLAIV